MQDYLQPPPQGGPPTAPEGPFAMSAHQLTHQQQQFLAKSISAMLCARPGLASAADPLLGNSRSSSPYMRPLEASTKSGSMDAAFTPLPPAVLTMGGGSGGLSHLGGGGGAGAPPMPAAAAPRQGTSRLLVAQFPHLAHHAPGHSCNNDSQCSHSSAHPGDTMVATGTPLSLLKKASTGSGTFDSPPAPAAERSDDCAAAAADAVPRASAAAAAPSAEPEHQQQQPLAGAAAAAARAACSEPVAKERPVGVAAMLPSKPRRPGVPPSPKDWLYELVTCPFLFKPCPLCAPSHSGREVLITYFDTDNPARGYCTYCPQRNGRPYLLQIRRSTYHEVVKAADVARLTDVAGIQHYVINGAKVLFLRPRPQPRPPKGVVAPARCAVDGRQLMDAHSAYCSLRCKLEVEDAVFAAHYPSAQEEMAAAGVAAGGGARCQPQHGGGSDAGGSCHRLAGGHEGRRVVVLSHKRAAPAGGGAAAASAAAAGAASSHDAHHNHHHHDDSSEDGGDADGSIGCGSRHKRARHAPTKYTNASGFQAAPGGGAGGARGAAAHHPHRGGSGGASRATRDDTISDQAAACAVPGGSSPMGLAGLHLLHRGARGPAASPCSSDDSGRSSTCNQRLQHKRKLRGPCRAPMQ